MLVYNIQPDTKTIINVGDLNRSINDTIQINSDISDTINVYVIRCYGSWIA